MFYLNISITENPCWLNLYGCKYASIASISDRYHLAHEGTCDGTDPDQSATKVIGL